MVIVMTIGWLVSVRLKNAGIVDFIWSFSFTIIALLFAAIEDGAPARKALLLLIVLPWTVRLGVYLLKRFLQEFPIEDKRYAAWREEWQSKADQNMFWVFQFQGLLIVILSVPFFIACADPSPLRISDTLGLTMCWIGLIGESIADSQLSSFKADKANSDKVCSQGLWNFSRHPNYFFEWIIWVGLFVFVSSCPFGIYAIYCPIVMLLMLTRFSGVQLTEEHALRTRGEEYKKYQQTTSAFVPWFKLTPKT